MGANATKARRQTGADDAYRAHAGRIDLFGPAAGDDKKGAAANFRALGQVAWRSRQGASQHGRQGPGSPPSMKRMATIRRQAAGRRPSQEGMPVGVIAPRTREWVFPRWRSGKISNSRLAGLASLGAAVSPATTGRDSSRTARIILLTDRRSSGANRAMNELPFCSSRNSASSLVPEMRTGNLRSSSTSRIMVSRENMTYRRQGRFGAFRGQPRRRAIGSSSCKAPVSPPVSFSRPFRFLGRILSRRRSERRCPPPLSGELRSPGQLPAKSGQSRPACAALVEVVVANAWAFWQSRPVAEAAKLTLKALDGRRESFAWAECASACPIAISASIEHERKGFCF